MRHIIITVLLQAMLVFQLSPVIQGQQDTYVFLKSAFGGPNLFFLGATNPATNKEYSLARAYQDGTTVKFKSLAPATSNVNNEKGKPNPLYDASINHLVVQNTQAVAALGTKNPADTTVPTGNNQTICLLADPLKGASVKVNEAIVKDANGDDGNGIAGIAASKGRIFAAVAPNGGNFGADNSGIAMLSAQVAKLQILDATTGGEGNKAVAVKADGTVADAVANVTVGSDVAMHWDESLNRLFVGLNVARSSGTPHVCGLLIGRPSTGDNPSLVLEPFIPVSTLMAADYQNYVIGFNSANSWETRIHNIKTMHTSTGKSYVIVNGKVYNSADPDTKVNVYALPVVKQQYTDKAITVPNDVGRSTGGVVSDANANYQNYIEQNRLVVAQADVPNTTQNGLKIGGGNTPSDVINMFVVGDSVYVCCAGTNETKGIFKSTALFNENGLISRWTPWQRVMGSMDEVQDGYLETGTGQFWYLTKKTTLGDLVKITQWNTTDDNLRGKLISKINTEFPYANAGIHQIFDFDESTQCFVLYEFSMMVATGYQKVALIQTGKDVSGYFEPTAGTDFDGTTYFKTYTDQALKDIGPICCAEVSRSTANSEGWLFVGGYGGLAVLRKSDGTGWTTGGTALTNITTDLTGFSFLKIGNFADVRKIVCDGTFLYVLTPKALYRITMDAAIFKDSPDAIDLTAATIATPSYTNLTSCTKDDSFLDFVVSGKIGLLATTSGLYRTANGKNVGDGSVANAREWTQVQTKASANLGPVTHLFFQSYSKGLFTNGGNLYAVAGNISNDLAAVIRFNVEPTGAVAISDDVFQPIAEITTQSTDPTRDYFYPFGQFRDAFVTDGSCGYHHLSRHFIDAPSLRKIIFNASTALMRAYETALPMSYENTAYNASIPLFTAGAGTWVAAGDWGMKLNE